MICCSSAIFKSSTRAPPWRISRRASLLLLARPARTNNSKAGMPPGLLKREIGTLIVGRVSKAKASAASASGGGGGAAAATGAGVEAEAAGLGARPPPSANNLRAVSATASAIGRPCAKAVASVARMIFAWLISAPWSTSSRAISESGRSVNSRMKRPTSASSVLRQNCQ